MFLLAPEQDSFINTPFKVAVPTEFCDLGLHGQVWTKKRTSTGFYELGIFICHYHTRTKYLE